MAQSTANLHILDEAAIARQLDLVSELFHRISRIIPENQELLTVPPDTTVRQAIQIMRKNGYCQVPVVAGEVVLGVFSYRSFSNKVAHLTRDQINKQGCAPGDLPVEEFIERFKFARFTDDMREVFDVLEKDNGVLIGSQDNLQGILTPMDLLNYLDKVASPFVMVSEIELALRALIRLAVSDEELISCAQRSLEQHYGASNVPKTLEEMTFDNYRIIISHSENWPKFESVFGQHKPSTTGKLKEVGELRNDLFHFKRPITLEDHEKLSAHRDWFLGKARQADLKRNQGKQK